MRLDEWEYRWATTPEHIRPQVWRAHRIQQLQDDNGPIQLAPLPTVAIHAIPEAALEADRELPPIDRKLLAVIPQFAKRILRHNADGIIIESDEGFLQLYHNGITEYVSHKILAVPSDGVINAYPLTDFLSDFLHSTKQHLYREQRTKVGIALWRVKDYRLVTRLANERPELRFDRDTIMTPLLEATDTNATTASLRRFIWRAAGYNEYAV